MRWRQIQIGEIANFSNGINFDKTAYASGVPLIGVSNFGNRFIPPYEELEQVKSEIVGANDYLADGDIVFVRSNGNKELVGRCMLIKDYDLPLTYSGFCIRCRLKDKSSFDPVFFTYYFKSSLFRKAISGSAVGANIQNLSQGRLASHMAMIPDYFTQRQIAEILYAYDDLIVNNQRQIKLLEEAAQRLYKEWFVDLRFPGHEHMKIVDGVPEGWKKCILDDVIDFNPKMYIDKDRLKQSVPMSALSTTSMILDSKEFTTTTSNAGSKFKNGDTLLARITPCLENGKTGFVDNIVSPEGAVGSTEFIVMRSKKLNPYIVYLLSRTESFRKTAINSMTGSEGRQRAQVDKIKNYEYLLPTEDVISGFAELMEPLFMMVSACNKQCMRLTEARDRLLPKLMSGEIEV